MSRRDQWNQVRDSIAGVGVKKEQTLEEREKMPQKACGICKNFSENAYVHDGRGSCGVLKVGSNIDQDPLVLVTEGETGLITQFNTDGDRCPYFVKMDFIDTSNEECSDPAFRRSHRQMEKL